MIELLKKIKGYLITIGICLLIFITIYIITLVNHRQELKREKEVAFVAGKAEATLTSSEKLLNDVSILLKDFSNKIDLSKEIIIELKEVSNNVETKLDTFFNVISNLDDTFNELRIIWENSN